MQVKEVMYAHDDEAALLIGNPSQGHTSNYYSRDPPPSDAEVEEVQALCDAAGVSTLNTRLAKEPDGRLRLRVASAEALPKTWPKTLKSDKLGFTLTLEPWDFAMHLSGVVSALREAVKYAGDANRAKMLEHYADSFRGGDYKAHDEASKLWVKDVGPVVEVNGGFVESYVDPWGSRAEWEGFVAVVNKAQSAKFGALVASAPAHIKTLPWGADFEGEQQSLSICYLKLLLTYLSLVVDVFQSPDFTSLEVSAPPGSGENDR